MKTIPRCDAGFGFGPPYGDAAGAVDGADDGADDDNGVDGVVAEVGDVEVGVLAIGVGLTVAKENKVNHLTSFSFGMCIWMKYLVEWLILVQM